VAGSDSEQTRTSKNYLADGAQGLLTPEKGDPGTPGLCTIDSEGFVSSSFCPEAKLGDPNLAHAYTSQQAHESGDISCFNAALEEMAISNMHTEYVFDCRRDGTAFD
jgi:hypothetical protein